MVGVDFDLALGINLSAIDIFRYIDWSLMFVAVVCVCMFTFVYLLFVRSFAFFVVVSLRACAYLVCMFAVIHSKNMIDFRCWCCSLALLAVCLFVYSVFCWSSPRVCQVIILVSLCAVGIFFPPFLVFELCVSSLSLLLLVMLALLPQQQQQHQFICTLFPSHLHLCAFHSNE